MRNYEVQFDVKPASEETTLLVILNADIHDPAQAASIAINYLRKDFGIPCYYSLTPTRVTMEITNAR